ncbi:MAG: NADH-quinone oxidoreductase subunit A [Dehalococcoidia bacterium]
MLGDWGHLGFLIAIGVSLPGVAIVVSFLLGKFKIRPSVPNSVKLDTYECGVETEGPSWVQFHVGYYVFALLFVVFDIETIFLFPWAVAFRGLKIYGFFEALLFIGILVLGLVYAWRKNALAWR